MQAARITELRAGLKILTPPQLIEICLRLAKFKKENKELLTYLLFESKYEAGYVKLIKEVLEDEMQDVNKHSLYLTKKRVRKVVRQLNKYVRYSDSKETEVQLRMHFCHLLLTSNIRIHRSRVLTNIFESQKKRIKSALSKLHEDLQYDYQKQVDELMV